jgi:hypothetical protein
MIIFQNNLELRPGGGHIGSFGILKVKNGIIGQIKTYDLSSFDNLLNSNQKPPYPIEETMNTSSWKMRDSNFSPDFRTNAKKANEFYFLVEGEQKSFDGIIALNTDVLATFLKVTGPIEISGYPGSYDSENAIISLEYQVEKGYAEQGIDKVERKSIMSAMADEILRKSLKFDLKQKIELAGIILEDLRNKDIQVYFADSNLEDYALATDWAGEINDSPEGDYLMMVDANLGSFKSDYYIERSFEYTVDLSRDTPEAKLRINYNHTAKEKDWMTKNYLTYLRVYVPLGSSLKNFSGMENPMTSEEFGKNYFSSLITVPLGESRAVEFNYTLPKDLVNNEYNLLIQKQSGLKSVPGRIVIIQRNGEKIMREIYIKRDWKLDRI